MLCKSLESFQYREIEVPGRGGVRERRGSEIEGSRHRHYHCSKSLRTGYRQDNGSRVSFNRRDSRGTFAHVSLHRHVIGKVSLRYSIDPLPLCLSLSLSLAGTIPPRSQEAYPPYIFRIWNKCAEACKTVRYAPFFNYVQPPLASNYFHPRGTPSERATLAPTDPPPFRPRPRAASFYLFILPVSSVFRVRKF